MRQPILSPSSPDGFGGALASRKHNVVADACFTIAILAEASRTAAPRPVQDEADHYDDGLVHDHGWARSSSR